MPYISVVFCTLQNELTYFKMTNTIYPFTFYRTDYHADYPTYIYLILTTVLKAILITFIFIEVRLFIHDHVVKK